MAVKPSHVPYENTASIRALSKSIVGLSTIADPQIFVRRMISLGKLLCNYERAPDHTLRSIDGNTCDPSYFVAAYLDTRNISDAMFVYRAVRSLTRHILLCDRFYETGNARYAFLARQLSKSTDKLLRSMCESDYLVHSVNSGLEQFSQFWHLERVTKRHILENHHFSSDEVSRYLLAKSSDAPLVYARVLDAKLPGMNETVGLILHCNQALLDILDDWDDITEDLQQDMPNLFVMTALRQSSYSSLKRNGREAVEKLITSDDEPYEDSISKMVETIQASVNRISLSRNFTFLKMLSNCYVDTLKETIHFKHC